MVSQGFNAAPDSSAETSASPAPAAAGRTSAPPASAAAGETVGTEGPGKHHRSAEQVLAAVTSLHDWVLLPRVRLTLIGVGLLLIGALMLTNSVWTLPVMIIGSLMVAIAWVGRRLEGRFAVQWGETGTELAFRARIRAPGPPRRPALLPPPSEVPAQPPDNAAERGREGVIEGRAHTVEIEVAELEALIAAADLRRSEASS